MYAYGMSCTVTDCLILWRQGLSLNQPSDQVPATLVALLHTPLGLQTCTATSGFLSGCWGFELGPHTCTESTFPHQAISLAPAITFLKAGSGHALYLRLNDVGSETVE